VAESSAACFNLLLGGREIVTSGVIVVAPVVGIASGKKLTSVTRDLADSKPKASKN
jgi:hypothetical protein